MGYHNTTNNINPKSCTYGCGLQIFWNSDYNQYWEVFKQKKHICPNRVNKPTTSNNTITEVSSKPTYYSKKPWSNTPPKPKMSNSFELLTGPSIETVQKKYEVLSDLVTEHNGKVHGSQRDRDPKTGLIDLLVYYEVHDGKREEVKRKYQNLFVYST
ncbi:MAG: hypothetical protein ACR2F1_15640 [Nitrososphaeraceae archaeon]